jgi:transcription elongation factor GreA
MDGVLSVVPGPDCLIGSTFASPWKYCKTGLGIYISGNHFRSERLHNQPYLHFLFRTQTALAERVQSGKPGARGYNDRSLAVVRPPVLGIQINMTDAIKRKLQEEINTLEHELIHELPKEIKKAAALGDLSENAEYHMAKQRQEFVKARVRQLGKRLAELSMINMNNIPHDKVGLGSTVKVYDNTKGEEVEYKLVTSEESDVAAGKISTTSPIGRALLNKKVGDETTVVTPNGKRELEILKLSTIHDEAEEEPKEAQA